MMRSLAGRFLHLVLVVLAVTACTFLVLDLLPVSIAHQLAGSCANAGDVADLRQRLGIDAPLAVRYGRWLSEVLRGDFGNSLSTGVPVLASIRAQFAVTLELVVLAQLIALMLAIPIAIVSAWRPDSGFDRLCGTLGFALSSFPNFALALVLMLVFSLGLKWFPATGFTPLSEGVWPNLRGMLLPAVSLAMGEWVSLMGVLRGDLISTLQEDFILLARAKGLPVWRILLRHALRPSAFSLITLTGLHLGNLIAGAVIIESLFALPGMGRLLLTAIFAQDYPVVQGCVLLLSVGYVVVNFTVDLCNALLDPRIRKEGCRG